MLTSKQRATLRSLSNDFQAIMQVGKGGVTENLLKTVSDALEARELIKMTVLENSGYTTKEAANAIAEAIGADVVSVVGKKFVLYRESVKNKKIELC